jgi:hypothetical protein
MLEQPTTCDPQSALGVGSESMPPCGPKARWWLGGLCLAVVSLGSAASAHCPFCSAVGQTLRQEMELMDAVAVGRLELMPDAAKTLDGPATFKAINVLQGERWLQLDQAITASYFGPADTTKNYLLMGVDPPELLWSSPLPLSAEAEAYLLKVVELPEDDSLARLMFYQQFLQSDDTLLARDSYDEFASTPYDEIRRLKPHMQRQNLLAWVSDSTTTAERKRLYFTMLGVCGLPEDVELLERLLRSQDPADREGLDALIACYLTLTGDRGLPLVEELFLTNPKADYPEIYSAIMALRFHGTEGNVLSLEKVTAAMHHILARPSLADLVIPDLARWEDWSQIDRLVQLFTEADDESIWVRVPVVNYLRACPLPIAAEKLKLLEEIDPKAVKRASTFFPIPAPPAPGKVDSSHWQADPIPAIASNRSAAGAASRRPVPSSRLASLPGDSTATIPGSLAELVWPELIDRRRQQAAQIGPTESLMTGRLAAGQPLGGLSEAALGSWSLPSGSIAANLPPNPDAKKLQKELAGSNLQQLLSVLSLLGVGLAASVWLLLWPAW